MASSAVWKELLKEAREISTKGKECAVAHITLTVLESARGKKGLGLTLSSLDRREWAMGVCGGMGRDAVGWRATP